MAFSFNYSFNDVFKCRLHLHVTDIRIHPGKYWKIIDTGKISCSSWWWIGDVNSVISHCNVSASITYLARADQIKLLFCVKNWEELNECIWVLFHIQHPLLHLNWSGEGRVFYPGVRLWILHHECRAATSPGVAANGNKFYIRWHFRNGPFTSAGDQELFKNFDFESKRDFWQLLNNVFFQRTVRLSQATYRI